ncbi:class I SAM-dependent methyltransferase [Halospeciosus flavus]|uniref:Class I SAM-dependent methyltransferase n=1 Tax=Halospeciosus flavus TaxID=3032283 RepID=A0ABD5Z2C5_9EURY
MPPAKRRVLAAGLDRAERPVRRVLDVGGGTGRAARVLGDFEPVVVDLSRPMLRVAHEKGLRTVQGDARRLPVADESVDAAVFVDALHHVPDVPAALADVARVLRPGGVLVVRDFDPTTLRGRALVAAEHLFGMGSTFYAPDDLASLLADAGLRPTVVETGFGYTVAGVKRRSEPREQ